MWWKTAVSQFSMVWASQNSCMYANDCMPEKSVSNIKWSRLGSLMRNEKEVCYVACLTTPACQMLGTRSLRQDRGTWWESDAKFFHVNLVIRLPTTWCKKSKSINDIGVSRGGNLGAVCIWSGISHGYSIWKMLYIKVLIFEAFSIDRSSPYKSGTAKINVQTICKLFAVALSL